MMERKILVSQGAGIASRNKRYVIWFYLLNLAFAWLGTAAFGASAHAVMDHSLYADKLLHGFDLAVLIELFSRPEFGPMQSAAAPSMVFAVLFLLASLSFMPGVLLGYSSDHRISRNEFFRTCSHNLWRFLRLFLFFLVIAGIIVGILSGIVGALAKAADKTSYERLPFFTHLVGATIVFLVLTSLRMWFDLAQTDVVLRDQGAVRKSIAATFRTTRRHFDRLLGNYVLVAIAALLILVAGIWLWHATVPPSSVFGAFLVSQVMLLLLLSMRFWQRAMAVAFYVKHFEEGSLKTETAALPATVATAQ